MRLIESSGAVDVKVDRMASSSGTEWMISTVLVCCVQSF